MIKQLHTYASSLSGLRCKNYYFLLVLVSCFTQSVAATAPVSVIDTSSTEPLIIDRIIITGNEKTKTYIITRELLFHEGDSLPAVVLFGSLARSKENVMNTQLFNFVDIHIYQAGNAHVDIQVEVTERWYIFPLPVFDIADRNFNEWWLTRDFRRTIYGANVLKDNFRGRNETLRFQFIWGYSQKFGIFYTIPYLNRKQNIGMTFSVLGTRNHEIAYNTIGNKLVFYKDPEHFMRKDLQAYVQISKRKGTNHYYVSTLEYRSTTVGDTIIKMNDAFFKEPESRQQFLALRWSYRYDKRDYQSYAQNGNLVEMEVAKVGLGLFSNEPDLLSVSLGYRHYQPIANRLNLSGSVKGRIMQRESGPYYTQKALGFQNDYIRGYEYYVMNGQDFFLGRSNLRYTLMKTKVYNLPYMQTVKFRKMPVSMYLNAFYDGGYVSDNRFASRNPLVNSWQYGYGFGYDYVTYYDLVFRFEYAWNKMGEHGFFFHIGTAL